MLRRNSKSLLLLPHLTLFIIPLILLLSSLSLSKAYPLSTQNKWIIDDSTNQRAKLVCINWAGHLQPMIPEGLHTQPLNQFVAQIVNNGFNCVRLTYAIYMWTRYENHIVKDTLVDLNLPEAIKGIAKNNPSFLNMSHVQVFDHVVRELGNHKVMVLLDNHVSEPKWCCNDDDENGFFHDRHFDPKEWVQGLGLAAKNFAGNPAVVAMSLRNELHGPRQNVDDWYKYITQGATTIHKENPQSLVVISGLNYDTELQFLKKRPLKIDLGKKLAFETHLYSWSGIGTLKLKDIWSKQPLNRVCALSLKGLDNRAGFLTMGEKNNGNEYPLIFTEFGFDESGNSEEDNKFLSCLQTYLVGRDMDWGLWALPGQYYLREDKVNLEDTFGILDASGENLRFPNFTQKFQLLQRKNQDPSSKLPYESVLYHPLTGECVKVNEKNQVELGSCDNNSSKWMHTKDGSQVVLVGTNKCLTADAEDLPALVSEHNCETQNSSWKSLSLSKLHLGIPWNHQQKLCLHKDSNSSAIVTAKCICIDHHDSLCLDDPRSQWFQFVPTNVV